MPSGWSGVGAGARLAATPQAWARKAAPALSDNARQSVLPVRASVPWVGTVGFDVHSDYGGDAVDGEGPCSVRINHAPCVEHNGALIVHLCKGDFIKTA
jgi:hypothetical protein